MFFKLKSEGGKMGWWPFGTSNSSQLTDLLNRSYSYEDKKAEELNQQAGQMSEKIEKMETIFSAKIPSSSSSTSKK